MAAFQVRVAMDTFRNCEFVNQRVPLIGLRNIGLRKKGLRKVVASIGLRKKGLRKMVASIGLRKKGLRIFSVR